MSKMRNALFTFRLKSKLDDRELQELGQELEDTIKDNHVLPTEEFEFVDAREEEGEPLEKMD